MGPGSLRRLRRVYGAAVSPPSVPSTAFQPAAFVGEALARVRAEQGVHLPLAVESGSRAWGFPSPDSDWDVRFVFVRPVAQHLTPWPARDVIELPLTAELDVNGWDLGKALKLLLKGNAVVIEWLTSPLVYEVDPALRDDLLAFAARFTRREAVGRHYLHLGLRQDREFLAGREVVPLKKLFYGLRPAAALRWLAQRPGEAVAPMSLPVLMAQGAPPAEVAALTAGLIARKAATREMGEGPAPPALLAFMRGEFEAAAGWAEADGAPVDPAARDAAAALYRRTVERLG